MVHLPGGRVLSQGGGTVWFLGQDGSDSSLGRAKLSGGSWGAKVGRCIVACCYTRREECRDRKVLRIPCVRTPRVRSRRGLRSRENRKRYGSGDRCTGGISTRNRESVARAGLALRQRRGPSAQQGTGRVVRQVGTDAGIGGPYLRALLRSRQPIKRT